ncbi:MAG: LysR family transcriptional regulator [Candidatus Limivicinus sp.]|nr:LysR family transcriptional regulator [Clostridiales bacterium]MDY3859515.1 LysR family transcriptional regulator [Candidatus Limivicinus sp.]
MDFSLLKSFTAVADEKSFSTAAKHLFISQQSLSKQIAKLEEELGTTLFVRSRPLSLTPDGRQFLQTAKEILQLKQQYEESSSHSFSGSHFIHVGIEHTVARAILPYVLPQYLKDHPDTYVKVTEESPAVLHKSIIYDAVDLVIGSINGAPDNYDIVNLCKKEHLLVVPKKIMHELAGDDYEQLKARFSEDADLSFFEKAPFIKIPRQSSGGRALNSYLKYYDINPRFVCELTNVENAFQLANSGLGVFIYAKLFWDMLGRELQEDYLKSIEIFPLPYLPDIDDVCAYYNRETGLHGKNKELLETFERFFDEYKKGRMQS